LYTYVYASILFKLRSKISNYCGGLHALHGVYPLTFSALF